MAVIPPFHWSPAAVRAAGAALLLAGLWFLGWNVMVFRRGWLEARAERRARVRHWIAKTYGVRLPP